MAETSDKADKGDKADNTGPPKDWAEQAQTATKPKAEKKADNKKAPAGERMAALESSTEDLKRRLDQIHGVYSSSEELSKAGKDFTKSLQAMNGANETGAKRYMITRPVARKKVVEGVTTTVEESAVQIERYFVGTAAQLKQKLETEVRWKGDGPFPYAVKEA